jgi:hypothetical protein
MIVKHEEFIQQQDQCLKALHDLHKNLSDAKSRHEAQVTQLKAALDELNSETIENISERINQVTCIVNEQLPTLTQLEEQAEPRKKTTEVLLLLSRLIFLLNVQLNAATAPQSVVPEMIRGPNLTSAGADQGGRNRYLFDMLLGELHEIQSQTFETATPPPTPAISTSQLDVPRSPESESPKKFNLTDSIFLLKVLEGTTLIGEILIKPSPSFIGPFMRNLGEFCLRTPRKFYSNVTQVRFKTENISNVSFIAS